MASVPEVVAHVDVIAGVRLASRDRYDPFGDQPVDVHLADGRIADIGPAGALPRRGVVLDADGCHLAAGLWDHHVHTVQWALNAQRTSLESAGSAAEAVAVIRDVAPLADGRRIGTGYRDALWEDAASLEALDAATGDVPTYLVNADAHSMWLNSAALAREGFAPPADGLLRENDAFEVSRRLNEVETATADAMVRDAAAAATARGIVGVVDLDMGWNDEAWRRRLADGFDLWRVEFAVYPHHLDRALAEGLVSGDPLRDAASDLVRVGPLKVIADGSLGTRTAACTHPYADDPRNFGTLNLTPDELRELMTAAAGGGLACAIHAIGDRANTEALDAFAATGAWGTIEHAQLIAASDLRRFARLGVGASVQPVHMLDDRDMTDSLWARQTSRAYPLRALQDAGATLLFGSDAPVAPLDPWAAIAAAVWRTRDGRDPWEPDQALDAGTALAASTRGGSADDAATIMPGEVSDLIVCEADPMSASADELRAMRVAATMIGGRLTHLA
ncbi:metal-dependent hydrolase [Microbacterium mangrovi]|uniref:Metal-dependent hydrolase n=1 Tax=Microbacterium mangrovi TaxID=1348253 RepID=A0A0B2A9F6_9MICO|nr:amidohydrolase family protein [Microbacterium mangrovi]KHK98241.1 metal-dependent hydrolase [Microbacterium mangrovi]